MPVEAKPLFRPEVIRPRLVGFRLPEKSRETMAKWAEMIGSGRALGGRGLRYPATPGIRPTFGSWTGVAGYRRSLRPGAEVRKVRGRKKPLSLAALRSLREEHARTIVPAQVLAAEARGLERQVGDLVDQAYGLTPDEVRLMWQTAPPRMPIAPPPEVESADMD